MSTTTVPEARAAAAEPAAPTQAPVSLGALFEKAVADHQAGRLGQAEAGYRAVLGQAPNSPLVLTNFSLLLRQTGRVDLGVALLRKALETDPGFSGALYSLGNAYGTLGRNDLAAAAYQRVLAIDPAHVYGHTNLGNAHHSRGASAAAAVCYRRAALSQPEAVDPRVQLGVVRQKLADARAADAYRSALALDPAKLEGWLNFGNVALDDRRPDDAARAYARSVRLRPSSADAQSNYASALRDLNRRMAAVARYHVSLALDPHHVHAYNNLGNTLNYQGRNIEAVIQYRRALRLSPHDVLAHFDLGITLLQLGQFREGWEEYEWRWASGKTGLPIRGFAPPLWAGAPMPGTLLVHAEQGMGDAVQFLRYLPMVAERVGAIVLEIHEPLICLCRGLPKVVQVVPRGGTLPRFDAHIPLLSLPHLFGTDLSTIPATIPYLRDEPERTAVWARRLGERKALRIGLVWAGSITFKGDTLRSPRLDAMMPLLNVPGVEVYALQMGDGRRDLAGRAMPATFTDLGPEIGSFADTVSIMQNLDLIVSSCTAPVHVAGAIGRPTWVLLPFAADWRWLTGRDDSPWYPTVRLFRQSEPGRWDDVVGRVAEALGAAARLHGSGAG